MEVYAKPQRYKEIMRFISETNFVSWGVYSDYIISLKTTNLRAIIILTFFSYRHSLNMLLYMYLASLIS